MQKDLRAGFLHLYHCFGPSRSPLARLLDLYSGDPLALIDAPLRALEANGIDAATARSIKQPQAEVVSKDLDWAQQPDNHIVTYLDSSYPALLREIDDFPALLYARGDISLLQTPQIAIVGSRLCTPGGAQTAHDFAAQLSHCGLTITSGLALGIDSQAHRGALQAGGPTIAVCATGLGRIYPARNVKLAKDIYNRGLLISEFPLTAGARKQNFPQRNRLISGLCLATLVVEAAKRSGSLITARLAAEQGREVFAIPGSIHNPQTRGCHQLIRDGARLVEQVSDIGDELQSLLGYLFEQTTENKLGGASELDAEHHKLLDVIGYDPVDSDTLVRRSGLTIDKLSSMLLILELNDFIRSSPGGCFVRI